MNVSAVQYSGDFSIGETGALAPMVGGDLHTMNHHYDVWGQPEPKSYAALQVERAPFVSTDIATNAADATADATSVFDLVAPREEGTTADVAVAQMGEVVGQSVEKTGATIDGFMQAAEGVGQAATMAGLATAYAIGRALGESDEKDEFSSIWDAGAETAYNNEFELSPMDRAKAEVNNCMKDLQIAFKMDNDTREIVTGQDIDGDGVCVGANAHLPQLALGDARGVTV